MKKIILLLAFVLISGILVAQKHKIGIVKAKNVTYEIKEDKRNWTLRNINNPDTTVKEIPNRYIMLLPAAGFEQQIGKIVHDHLSREELIFLEENGDSFGVRLRVARDKYKILQVVHFYFKNRYTYYKNMSIERRSEIEKYMELPTKYEGFWLNFPLDRLHEIEKDIVDKVRLPADLDETFLVDDFDIGVLASDICNAAGEKQKREETGDACSKRDTIQTAPDLMKITR